MLLSDGLVHFLKIENFLFRIHSKDYLVALRGGGGGTRCCSSAKREHPAFCLSASSVTRNCSQMAILNFDNSICHFYFLTKREHQ